LLFRGDGEASSALKDKFWKMKDCHFSLPLNLMCAICACQQKKNAGDERLIIQTWRDMQRLAKRHRPQCLFSVMPLPSMMPQN